MEEKIEIEIVIKIKRFKKMVENDSLPFFILKIDI
jgi:hypothetical protein